MQPQLELPEEQLQLWSDKLERETGVQLGQLQASLLPSQIVQRMRELNLTNVDDYFGVVSHSPPEWQILLDRLLVKETHFFRNREVLKGIKQLVSQRINDQTLAKNFDVWSLGCATGEEAYSIAATLHDSLQQAPNHYYSVTGLDISQKALSVARSKHYPSSRLALAKPFEVVRYFDQAENGFRVKTEIASRVTFVRGNLTAMESATQMPMDVIVCLNVLIYFRRWRRRELLNRLVKWLKPGGVLIVGSGELPGWQHPKLNMFAMGGAQAYQMPEDHALAD